MPEWTPDTERALLMSFAFEKDRPSFETMAERMGVEGFTANAIRYSLSFLTTPALPLIPILI
jgi:hypothetical protein